jgi:hypothetical protein
MPTSRSSLLAVVMLASNVMVAAPARAQDFLSPGEATRVLMDGRPWAAVTTDGRRAKITLNKDGTGSFEGPFTFSLTWEVRGRDVCLHISIAGTKCVRFQPVADGYAGYNGTTLDLTLTR